MYHNLNISKVESFMSQINSIFTAARKHIIIKTLNTPLDSYITNNWQ